MLIKIKEGLAQKMLILGLTLCRWHVTIHQLGIKGEYREVNIALASLVNSRLQISETSDLIQMDTQPNLWNKPIVLLNQRTTAQLRRARHRELEGSLYLSLVKRKLRVGKSEEICTSTC